MITTDTRPLARVDKNLFYTIGGPRSEEKISEVKYVLSEKEPTGVKCAEENTDTTRVPAPIKGIKKLSTQLQERLISLLSIAGWVATCPGFSLL